MIVHNDVRVVQNTSYQYLRAKRMHIYAYVYANILD